MTTKHAKQKIFTVAAMLFSLTAFSQLKVNSTDGNQLKIIFDIKAGDAEAKPGNNYTTPFGEPYTLQKFRYYITQVQLLDSSDMSVQFFPDDYYLIDAGDSGSRTVTIPLSISHITSISFLVGVDSSASVSGVQAGALDPANGMFWTWNSGYVMVKLQGTSPVAKVPANAFSLDAGGFKAGENAARKIELLTHTPKRQVIHTIKISVDINKMFNGVHDVKLADHPLCHEPGPLAMQLADNYATMFSVQQVSR